MSTQKAKKDRGEPNESKHFESMDERFNYCCGPEMFEMTERAKGCPCVSMMKGSRKTFLAFLIGAGILFSIIVTGWVLGVVAFFQTI